MKKYIKGKDGKFKGSLPSPASIPAVPSGDLPKVPSSASNPNGETKRLESKVAVRGFSMSEEERNYVNNFATNLHKERLAGAVAKPEYLSISAGVEKHDDAFLYMREDDFCLSVYSKEFKGFTGVAIEDDDNPGLYNASLGSSSFNSMAEDLLEKQFDSLDEAEKWLTEELNKRTYVMSKFRNLIKEDPYGLEKTITSKLEQMGRGDLVPIVPSLYSMGDGVKINGSQVLISYTAVPFGNVGVLVGKGANSPISGLHGYSRSEDKEAVLFGLFVALSE